jgi:8-hydroxy-5-deazaflavin:NADPH oxidoreductase
MSSSLGLSRSMKYRRTLCTWSGAEKTAKATPASAHVVKAFNILFGHVLAADQAEGRPLDVFIAGDDAAKALV